MNARSGLLVVVIVLAILGALGLVPFAAPVVFGLIGLVAAANFT